MRILARLCLAACLAALTSLAGAQAPPAPAPSRAPLTPAESVRIGLTMMSDVVVHSDGLIAAHAYEQFPQQQAQFEQGLSTLQRGMTLAPPEHMQLLERLLAKARVAASGMTEAARTHNDSLLKITHDQLAAAVSGTIRIFPSYLQPAPGGAAP
jgi:hypothetical protein